MIFAPLQTIQQEMQYKANQMAQWGRPVKEVAMIPADELAAKHLARRETFIDDFGCWTLKDAAAELGFDPKAYEKMAEDDQALLFVMEDGEKLLPMWSLKEDGTVNPIAISVAKFFKNSRGWEDAFAFCRFLHNEVLSLSADHIYAETGNQDIISHEFRPRLQHKFKKTANPRAMARNLMDAIDLAQGKNEAYVSAAIRGLMERLTESGHRDDTLKGVFWSLPKPGKAFPKPKA